MDLHLLSSSSSSLSTKSHSYINVTPITTTISQNNCFKLRFRKHHSFACKWKQKQPRLFTSSVTKAKRSTIELEKESVPEKKGSISGAVALIIGTSIGSGILALPQKASPAGIVPSSITIITCWAFLLIEALLLVEINVSVQMKKEKKEGNELEVISIRTLAQETLGDFGGVLATVFYVFLGYTSMIAYTAKSGQIIFHLINVPESVSGFVFTAIFTILISIGGTRITDQVNQFLTASMIGLLVAIEVLAVTFGGWSGFDVNTGNWDKVSATIPVIVFSLVYHDIISVLCAYLGGDLTRLRASMLLGSLIPLLAILVWDAIALGLSVQADQVVDPVELLRSVRWSGIPLMVEAFSLLAVGTSLIGTLLAFSEFFKEQLNNLSWKSSTITELQQQRVDRYGLKNWWESKKIGFTAMAMVVAPTLLVSTTVPDAFSAATDIAGGYCMTMLYGVLPPAMAWTVYSRGKSEKKDADIDSFALSEAMPILYVVGLFAACVVVEQILQDWSSLQLSP